MTTIQDPNPKVESWMQITDSPVIVIGDRKTPSEWTHQHCDFHSIDSIDPEELSIVTKLPENHYSRKNIGYLKAMQIEAKSILDTDDDNFPLITEWNSVLENTNGSKSTNKSDKIIYRNIYSYFTSKNVPFWPRGFPLNALLNINSDINESTIQNYTQMTSIAIWQGLVDNDPDIDAIHRLIYKESPHFLRKGNVVLSNNNLCPFNSQNTLWTIPDTFPLMYLPSTVSFRFTDILRGYIAQIILHQFDYYVGFTAPTAWQERNPHDLMKDFDSEIIMYSRMSEIIDFLLPVVNSKISIIDNLVRCYEELTRIKVTKPEELDILNAWLNDFHDIRN